MNNTTKKFTVILSAYQSAQSAFENMIASEALYNKLANLQGGFVNPLRAVGVYAGIAEQSFIVNTSSRAVLEDVKRLAWEHNQECVLVSSNRINKIVLQYPTGKAPMLLGTRFAYVGDAGHMALLNAPVTVVNGQVWSVK